MQYMINILIKEKIILKGKIRNSLKVTNKANHLKNMKEKEFQLDIKILKRIGL